jgi:hypothetical protein
MKNDTFMIFDQKVRQYCLNILHLLKEFIHSSHVEIIRIYMMQYLFSANLAQKIQYFYKNECSE